MSLGAKLKQLRLRSGQSLKQVADKVGVSKAHIYELEIEKVKNPSIELLKKISKLFNTPVVYFIEENKDLEFNVMYRDLEKDFSSLDERDKKTIELMVSVFKQKGE